MSGPRVGNLLSNAVYCFAYCSSSWNTFPRLLSVQEGDTEQHKKTTHQFQHSKKAVTEMFV